MKPRRQVEVEVERGSERRYLDDDLQLHTQSFGSGKPSHRTWNWRFASENPTAENAVKVSGKGFRKRLKVDGLARRLQLWQLESLRPRHRARACQVSS